VSATETPPSEAAPQPPVEPERRCPRCGAELRLEQEWCLNCGTGVGARVAAPRGWRWPLAVVGGLLALGLIAIVLAIVELSNDAEQVTTAPVATPAPTAAPPAATPTPTPTAAAPTPTPTPTTASGLASWPAGKTGYTIVLESSRTRSAAEARGKELAGQGIPVGILDSSGYRSLTPNRYVVFSGQYATKAAARAALQRLEDRAAGAQVKLVAPA
jgi:septal ring-binding cell division protein DamX